MLLTQIGPLLRTGVGINSASQIKIKRIGTEKFTERNGGRDGTVSTFAARNKPFMIVFMVANPLLHGRLNNPFVYLALIVMIALAVALAALPRLERAFLMQSGERSESTLRLAVEGLEGALRRYEPLPALVAERPVLRTLLSEPDNELLKATINSQLQQTAADVSASDVYLMDATGLTLVSSNHHKERSFIGRSFYFRPYFTQALAGEVGRYFALGTTSGERGYFFAAPVNLGDRVAGVVAVKFTVDTFEEAWRAGNSDIIVTDSNDVIFMSNRPEWHFRSLSPLSPDALAGIEADRQYPLERVIALQNQRVPLNDRSSLIEITDQGATKSFIARSMPITEAGWNVTILSPTGPAKTQALAVLALLAMLILSSAMVAAIALQRRARQAERFEAQRATQELLEQRVAERTADLNSVNRQLIDEIEERKRTEEHLRKTRADLVQAGKLAALGQMSAALSHEFNQPLAAVKAYAGNAVRFLDRDRTGETRDNIQRISEMTDRMASIANHLRNFARRPQQKPRPIPLLAAIDDAVDLMDARIKSSGASIKFDRPDNEIWIVGGHVRLQQVMVNLLSNALDAMENDPEPIVEIGIIVQDCRCRVEVRDHGSGLADDQKAEIFDPFFTTKSPGKGLGLGLSISYNIIKDFGGNLSTRNHTDAGAVFIIDLKLAETPSHAASNTNCVTAE